MNAALIPTTPEAGLFAPGELKIVHERLTFDERRALVLTARLCAACLAAPTRGEKLAVLERAKRDETFRPIWGGISEKSIYRKIAAWRETKSALALADGRTVRKMRTVGEGLGGNEEFVSFWQGLCLENKRKTAPARRKLFALLADGAEIPGLGTWREIWKRENGGMEPDAEMACPYFPGVEEPQGWSKRRLGALAPGKFALAAARHGTMQAQMDFGALVKRTRVALKSCQVVQIDDMWYEHKVSFAGNKHAQRVVEYALIDVLTGHVVSYLTKPVRERADGTRETLKSRWTRYLVAHLLCEAGIPPEGCLVMGEHGTASADAELRAALAEVSGGHVEWNGAGRAVRVVDGAVRFGAGGILSQPLAKGLYGGRPKGNPRYKGLLEGFHGLIKNELGDVRGMAGGGRGLEPETVYGMDKRDEALRALVAALEPSRPGLAARLQMPYVPYEDFMALVHAAYERLDARVDHALEGWEACGFVVGEYKPTPSSPWVAWEPGRLGEKQARAFKYLIDCEEIPFRTRRMSPGEAWRLRAGERRKMEPYVAAAVMGRELSRVCVVNDHLQMKYRDEETLAKCDVSALLTDGRTLRRGGSYRVWVNPLTPEKAFVAEEDGRFLGVAPVLSAARYDDASALEAQLGRRAQILAAERRRLAPALVRTLREENERARVNVLAVTGEDPVQIEMGAALRRDALSGAGDAGENDWNDLLN